MRKFVLAIAMAQPLAAPALAPLRPIPWTTNGAVAKSGFAAPPTAQSSPASRCRPLHPGGRSSPP